MGEDTSKSNFSLNCSPSIMKAIKSKRLSWVGHVAGMEYGRSFKILTGKPI